MPLPTSLQSYQDCLDFFEKVVDDPKGGRVCLGGFYGASEYDPLQLKLREDHDGEWWVYAERTSLDPSMVELLSEMDE